MTSVSSPASGRGRAPLPAAGRVRGVDAARGLAVLGMVAVHVGHASAPDGTPSWEYLAFAGLSSAAFVVVAGVSLALSWPGPDASSGSFPTTAARSRRTARLLLRAGLLFLLGLLLGLLDAPVAVILCHYGVLFALAPPLLRLRTREALAAGVAWTLLGPVAVFAATTLGWFSLGRNALSVEGRLWDSPVPADLLQPDVLGLDLLLTGYYPVLSWGGFLLLGIGLGRALEAARATGPGGGGPVTAAEAAPAAGGESVAASVPGGAVAVAARRMLAAGAAAWAVGAALWLLLPRRAEVLDRVTAATGLPADALRSALLTGEHNIVWLIPDPLWLALAVPHGGGVGEALRVAGAATAVLGLCVLLADRRASAARLSPAGMSTARASGTGASATGRLTSLRLTSLRLTAPLEAVGRIPLTLYAGHLVVLAPLAGAGLRGPSDLCDGPGWCWDGTTAVLLAWAGCLVVALVVRALRRRGPLEAGLQAAVGAVVGK